MAPVRAPLRAQLRAAHRNQQHSIRLQIRALPAEIKERLDKVKDLRRSELESLLADRAHAAVMTADLHRLDPRLRRRLVAMRDGYEQRFVQLVAALPLAAGTDRSLWRLQLLGSLNWTPTWYRRRGKSPAAIARSIVANLR